MNLTSSTGLAQVLNRNRSHAARLWALVAAGLLLGGCVTRQLEPDFAAVSQSYADNMNWQMLLNLARLDQGHPAYFMAIGEVRVARSQSTSLQGSGTSSHTTGKTMAAAVTSTVSNVLSGTLTPSTTSKTDPSFVFIPINSTDTAKQLLEPVSIEVFNTLYQQGWPVDQLLRVLVERIEIDLYDKEGQHLRLVLTNSPTRAESWELFARFLRACEVVRELQKRGGLRLKSEEHPLPPGSESQAQKPAPGALADDRQRNPKPGALGANAPRDAANGTPDDSADSTKLAKDERKAPAMRTIYQFISDKDILNAVLAELDKDPAYRQEQADPVPAPPKNYPEATESLPLKNFRMVFSSTLTVGASPVVDPAGEHAAQKKLEKNEELPAPKNVARTVLVLRSFRSVLDAVAQEQRAFDQLADNARIAFFSQIPFRQRRPVLRTDWSKQKGELLSPVADLKFAGVRYQITDLKSLPADPDSGARDFPTFDSRWNRDVFRLLIDLSSQVNVDITKFQRQTLELSQ